MEPRTRIGFCPSTPKSVVVVGQVSGGRKSWEWTGTEPSRCPMRIESDPCTIRGVPLGGVFHLGPGTALRGVFSSPSSFVCLLFNSLTLGLVALVTIIRR